MCKRLIEACPMCRKWTQSLGTCVQYDKDKKPNMFSSGWFYEHGKRSKVKNSIKFRFCDRCSTHNGISSQPECDQYYKRSMETCLSNIRQSYVGSIEIRNRMPIRTEGSFGVIFLD